MIDSFTGEHRFLSNFWACAIPYEGLVYPSVEHAYVAAKVTDDEVRKLVQSCATAGQVKRLGRKLPLRPDWEVIKLLVMRDLLATKFTEPGLQAKLLATGEHQLVEGNTWGDTFWGVCNGIGSNNLGTLLMALRTRFQAEHERSSHTRE